MFSRDRSFDCNDPPVNTKLERKNSIVNIFKVKNLQSPKNLESFHFVKFNLGVISLQMLTIESFLSILLISLRMYFLESLIFGVKYSNQKIINNYE